MTNKKTARRALFSSVLALILCCCMLVGTTFAWFTDEVTTGMNTIAAGNLDIELLRNGEKVDSATKLFNKVTLWEPGVVIYENLQVANVGTLALKYRLSLNFGNENNLNGHKLSEVLKIAVIDKIADNATREEVLEAAKNALADDQGAGTLANFFELGELEAGTNSAEKTFVIFWEPNDNATDNLYNANNGQITSDGKPLHIEFGVKLEATQMMSENDSFGNDYDEPAAFLPKATVNNITADIAAKYPNGVSATAGIGGAVNEIPLDFALQFLPNETVDPVTEELTSDYKDWHADYVVVADDVVPADSVALAGYYKEWCQFNNDNWVSLTGPEVAAGQEVRLVRDMVGVTVSYEEICLYGADGTGFLCGVADLTGANKGTTLTVQLRLYETDETLGALSSFDSETGEYKVIGEFAYTFGGNWTNLDDGTVLFTNEDGNVQLVGVEDVADAAYTVPNVVTKLGNSVFSGNSNITSVTIPATVTDFGASGVSETNASGGAFKNSAVETVVLEEGLTEIPAAAFNGATNLTSVNIPSSVTSIGVNALRSTALTELTIPATVTNIGYGAFRDMDSLTTVTIEGDNVTLPGYVFRDCSALTTVYLNMETLTLNGSMNFANASSNNPGTNNIKFYTKNSDVADAVKAHMGVGSNIEIYVNGVLYAEIK